MKRNSRDKSGDLVDQNLRRAFEQISDEELPDRFKNLLEQLKAGDDVSSTSQETGE